MKKTVKHTNKQVIKLLDKFDHDQAQYSYKAVITHDDQRYEKHSVLYASDDPKASWIKESRGRKLVEIEDRDCQLKIIFYPYKKDPVTIDIDISDLGALRILAEAINRTYCRPGMYFSPVKIVDVKESKAVKLKKKGK